MAPSQFCTRTVYKRPPGYGPAEAAEEEGSGLEIQERDGVRMVEEPLEPQVYQCQLQTRGTKARERRGEDGRREAFI